jgi:hypothetical protein
MTDFRLLYLSEEVTSEAWEDLATLEKYLRRSRDRLCGRVEGKGECHHLSFISFTVTGIRAFRACFVFPRLIDRS